MENVCVRLDSALSRQIEKDMRYFRYSTKTEFIREAIRDKLKVNDKERAWRVLFAARGIFKGKAPVRTKEEEQELEKKIDKEIRAHYEEKFGIKLM